MNSSFRKRALTPAVRRRLAWTLLLGSLGAAGRAEDSIAVPGGAEAMRRLFRVDPGVADGMLLPTLNDVWLAGGSARAAESLNEARQTAVDFASDRKEWLERFGSPAQFSASSPAEWVRCRRALDWLGYETRGTGTSFEAEPRPDATSRRRQRFLGVLGTPADSFLADLRAGGAPIVSCRDGSAPLPFGFAAWRETLADPHLDADHAFLFFVENPRASQMLSALERLDPISREFLRRPLSAGAGPSGWRLLYEESLEPFFRLPEALEVRGGRFVLPSGAAADPVWTKIFGVAPTNPAAFLRVFYQADGGRAAAFVDALRRLPDDRIEALVADPSRGEEMGGLARLYASMIRTETAAAGARGDPHDFAHRMELAAALADEAPLLSGDPQPDAPTRDTDGLPRPAHRGRPRDPAAVPATWRLSLASRLSTQDPIFSDAGIEPMLVEGVDRLVSAYSIFEDIPFARPDVVRRYLATLARLDRLGASRGAALRAGLFQCDVQLIALLCRSESISPEQAEDLLSTLLEVPLFASEGVSPAAGEAALFAWLSERLLPAVEVSATRLFRATPTSPGSGDEPSTPDERMDRSLVGSAARATLEWRGGRYAFDPADDDFSRRRAFLASQRLASLEDLAALHRELAAPKSSTRGADEHEAAEALATRLDLGGGEAAAPDGGDLRDRAEEERARGALASTAAAPADLDAVIAERHLEALLGHVYAASAGNPDDLYYQDPYFVRRHAFCRAEPGRPTRSVFAPTVLVAASAGGFRVSGSVFGLPDVLGLLHAEQLPHPSGGGIPNEAIRSGLVSPIRRMSVSRIDPDSLAVVAAACDAAREFAISLAARPPAERFDAWDDAARGLVSRRRLALASGLEGETGGGALDAFLSPTDLYRVGRRLAFRESAAGIPAPPAARAVREAIRRLVRKYGERGARDRLAEFGPSAEAYASRWGLADIDMPSYERLATYRVPQILASRLYDLKVAVACETARAGLPAGILPMVLTAALDRELAGLSLAHAYDWSATTRAAEAFSRDDLREILDDAVAAGRLVRDEDAAVSEAAR